MKIHIDEHPGDLTPDDITEVISALMGYIDEHTYHRECQRQCLNLTLIIDKLAWMLPNEPTRTWLDDWKESWERTQ